MLKNVVLHVYGTPFLTQIKTAMSLKLFFCNPSVLLLISSTGVSLKLCFVTVSSIYQCM